MLLLMDPVLVMWMMLVFLLAENNFVYANETKPVLAVSELLVLLERREQSRLRRRENNNPRGVGDAGGSRSLGVSSGRGAGAGAESRLSASAEALKCSDSSFSSLFVRCMSPSQRVAHVSDSVTRLLTTPTRDMHINSCGSMH